MIDRAGERLFRGSDMYCGQQRKFEMTVERCLTPCNQTTSASVRRGLAMEIDDRNRARRFRGRGRVILETTSFVPCRFRRSSEHRLHGFVPQVGEETPTTIPRSPGLLVDFSTSIALRITASASRIPSRRKPRGSTDVDASRLVIRNQMLWLPAYPSKRLCRHGLLQRDCPTMPAVAERGIA